MGSVKKVGEVLVKDTLWSLIQATVLLMVCSAAAPAPIDPYVRILQLEQARSLGGSELAEYLNGRDRPLALRAALAIGRTRLRDGSVLLAPRMRDSDPSMRAMAVYGLGLIGDAGRAASILRALRNDRDPAVRAAALDALDRLESAKTLPAYFEHSAADAIAVTLRNAPESAVRARAATALAAFSNSPRGFFAELALRAAFERERVDEVRWHIMWSVFRGYANRVPRTFLTHQLKDRNEIVRIEAARALGRVKNVDAVPALQLALHDSSWRVREQAMESVRQLQGKPLTDHLKVLPSGVIPPKIEPDRFADLPALPRTPISIKPERPTALRALQPARFDPGSLARFTGPMAGPHPRVRIVTTKGNLYLKLYPEWAPLTVENFLDLADRGYYDNNRWFRIVPDFVVQTGDPTDTGDGDAGYTIPAEENPLEQRSYIVSMGLNYDGNKPQRDSAGTQFYITLSPQLHLNRDFTVFGSMVGGFDVLGRLVETDRIVRVERIEDSSD
ncbi:MAG: peptidylprolyl isomerase [Candidatus Eremiobacteraeota bacterium]|nr:peptidylprolyl isomerase [Candidatus Eremiobacteraeota bacterium]